MLSPEAAKLIQPLLDHLPFDRAMGELVPERTADSVAIALAGELETGLPSDSLKAGLWLFVDDLDRSHGISQSIEDPVGSFWHGIMHRREGDFSNSKYWFRRSGKTPFELEGYDPSSFVDEVSMAQGASPPALVEKQRQEWAALFSHCVQVAQGVI